MTASTQLARATGKRVDRILLIEDDADYAAFTAIWLRGHGYDVAIARDGTLGVDQALERPPSLILLDLGLPDADGFDILKKLRSNVRLRRVPLLVLSADDSPSAPVRAVKLGARDFVHKWATSWELLQKVEAVLREAQSRLPPL